MSPLVQPTRILIVGGGGREHALAWKLAAEPGVNEVARRARVRRASRASRGSAVAPASIRSTPPAVVAAARALRGRARRRSAPRRRSRPASPTP